jgi:hypothetical protein
MEQRAEAVSNELREKLAELAHQQWTGWMEYLFGNCRPGTARLDDGTEIGNGTMVIPQWAVERWRRQMQTPYAELSESDKNSDRKEADKVLALLEGE